MAEPTSALPTSALPTSVYAAERRTYDHARQVGYRAAVTESPDSDRVQRAISRLDAFLSAGRPPRQDVPPGFYLNIRV